MTQVHKSPLRRGAASRLARIEQLLAEAYGTPESTLDNKDDPLDEAIYIVLSFQTDLKRFSTTWCRLRTIYPTWEDVEAATVSGIGHAIREGGLQRQKARTIKALLAEVRRVNGSLSLDALRNLGDDAAEQVLTRLPGLSAKAARCVLLYSLDRNVFPVDGNTFRIFKRIGILRPDAIYKRRISHDALQAAVLPELRRSFHVNLVIHGQRTCLPLRPRCTECPIHNVCEMRGVPSAVGSSSARVLAKAQNARTRGRRKPTPAPRPAARASDKPNFAAAAD